MIRKLEFADYEQKGFPQHHDVEVPSLCPMCHTSISPDCLGGFITDSATDSPMYTALFMCPACRKTFMVTYPGSSATPDVIAPFSVEKRIFSDRINAVSESFQDLYHQARVAEANGLTDLAGVAYRKALEFLVKDYLILKSPESSEDVRRRTLSQCIASLDYPDLQALSRACSWIANDCTHYERQHPDFGLDELKLFLDGAVSLIDLQMVISAAEAFVNSRCRNSSAPADIRP